MHKEKGMYIHRRNRILGVMPGTFGKNSQAFDTTDDTAACGLKYIPYCEINKAK